MKIFNLYITTNKKYERYMKAFKDTIKNKNKEIDKLEHEINVLLFGKSELLEANHNLRKQNEELNRCYNELWSKKYGE